MEAGLPTPMISQLLRSYAFRICVYGAVTFLVFFSGHLAIQLYGAPLMGLENGPIELAQVALAILAAVLLFYSAHLSRIGRAGLVLAGAVVAYAAAREMDQVFESLMFDDAYKWVVGLPMAALVTVTVIRERDRVIGETMWWMCRPPATLFAVGGIYLCFVCQFLDRPEMWTTIQDPQDAVFTKAMVEEYTELFAYLLLAFSGIESAIHARQDRRAASDKHTEGDESYPRIAA